MLIAEWIRIRAQDSSSIDDVSALQQLQLEGKAIWVELAHERGLEIQRWNAPRSKDPDISITAFPEGINRAHDTAQGDPEPSGGLSCSYQEHRKKELVALINPQRTIDTQIKSHRHRKGVNGDDPRPRGARLASSFDIQLIESLSSAAQQSDQPRDILCYI